MNRRTMNGMLATVLLTTFSASCSDGTEAEAYPTPTLTGDDHILSVAEGVGLKVADDAVVDLGRKVCEYIEKTGGDFDGIDDMVGESSDDPATVLKLGVVALAGVPAYCPEWTDELIAWTERQDP